MINFDEIKIIKIEKKNLPNIEQTTNIATIELYQKGKLIDKKEVRYFDQDMIFEILDKKDNVDLSNSLIIDFNLDIYREKRNIQASQNIEINNFIANNSIFYSQNEINFRRGKFVGQVADFTKSLFISPKIIFKETDFSNCEENFHSCVFKADEINFNFSVFGNKYHDFRNSKFEGKKNFENIIFLGGDIDFVGVDFGNGDIHFIGTHFGNGRVLFRLSIFGDGRKDFSRVNFGQGDVSFEKVKFGNGDINFRSTIFGNGKKDFRRCYFGKGKKNFSNAIFGNGTVEFVGSDFNTGKITFKLSKFGNGNIDFHYCHFGDGDILFDKTIFGQGDLDFRAVDFDNCRIIFNRITNEQGNIIFEASQMKSGFISFKNSILGQGNFNFTNCIFNESDIILENLDFGYGTVSFFGSKFRNILFKGIQINNYFDLRISQCQLLDLSETVIKDIIDLKSLNNTIKINSIDLQGIRLLGVIYLSWQNLKIKDLILQQNSSWDEKAEQFRMLKENFHNLGMYTEEDLAYIEFKRAEAKAILNKKKQKGLSSKIMGYISYGLKNLIMDKIGHYATNPVRVLVSMLIIYLFFSFVYLFLESFYPEPQIISSLFSPDSPKILNKVAKAFYHSAITFLTIGYGDYYPNSISRWLSAIEGFTGLFMMSYFTVAFVRKILR